MTSFLNRIGKIIVFVIAVVLLVAILGLSAWLSSTLSAWTGGLLVIPW